MKPVEIAATITAGTNKVLRILMLHHRLKTNDVNVFIIHPKETLSDTRRTNYFAG
jgi:hypothetical protein